MPDIDSLPTSYSPARVYSNGSDNRHSPSPRASSSSLAAAATINAGIQHEDSHRSSIASNRGRPSPQIGRDERRRSNAFLSSYDPALPGPGELHLGDVRSPTSYAFRTASPQGLGSPIMGPHHRDRAPSLGELHQELEQEQEAQVVYQPTRHCQFALLTYFNPLEPSLGNDPSSASSTTSNAAATELHAFQQLGSP